MFDLKKLIVEHGERLTKEWLYLDAVLEDILDQYRRKSHALVQAVRLGLDMPDDVLMERIHSTTGIDKALAEDAVKTWREALGSPENTAREETPSPPVLEHTWGRGEYIAMVTHGTWMILAAATGIYVYDTEDFSLKRTLALKAAPSAIAIASDGRELAVAVEHSILLVDMKRFEIVHALDGHIDNVTHLAYAHKGTLVSVGHDHTVHLWKKRKLVHTIEHTSRIQDLAASADHFAIIRDKEVMLYDMDGKLLYTINGSNAHPQGLAFSPDGKHLYIGAPGRVRCWSMSEERLEYAWTQPQGLVTALSVSDQFVAAGGQGGIIYLWDRRNKTMLLSFQAHHEWVKAVHLLDDAYILSAGNGGAIAQWTIDGGHEVWALKEHWGDILDISCDRSSCAAIGNGWLILGDTKVKHRQFVAAHHLDMHDKTLAIATRDGLGVFDIAPDMSLKLRWGHPMQYIHALAISKDGERIAVSFKPIVDKPSIQVFHAQDGSCAYTLHGHKDIVNAMTYDEVGNLVTASMDRTLRHWDHEGHLKRVILNGYRYVQHIAVSHGLVAQPAREIIRLIDLQSGKVKHKLEGHHGHVRTVCFGKGHLISGDDLGVLHIWDIQEGKIVHSIEHTHGIRRIAICDPYLVVGGEDGVVRFYRWI